MKDRIEMLEKSFKTNINMAKAMVKLNHRQLAEKYLKMAKKDKVLLDIYNQEWNLNKTKTLA